MHIRIRSFHAADVSQMYLLFYETVHSVNSKDYSKEQLDAWAPRDEMGIRQEAWKKSMSNNITFVAEYNGSIVGFSDMTYDGHLDRLYVHKAFQGCGIASRLVTVLESEAEKLGLVELDTEASITAKSFFEYHGFQLVREQKVERNGVILTNYKMTKMLNRSITN